MPWEPRRKSLVKSNWLRQITSSLLKPTIPPCFIRWIAGCKRLVQTALYPHLVNTGLKPDITALKFAKSGLSQLIYSRRWFRQTNGLDYRRLWSWNAPVIYGIKPPTKLSSTSAVYRQPVRELRRQFDNTRGLKTPCIGRWMSLLLKMIVGSVLFMPSTIWHFCVALHSMHSIERRPASAVCGRSQNGQRWMISIC